MAIESPTVYVNPYYVAIPYLQTQMVSKHYYMGSQRVASSMAEVPSQIASPPASGGGEGGEEFASANLSSPDDPVIIDFISTMNCVYNASIDLAFDESLSMPELDQINFHNCEGEEFPPEELAQEDPMCLCEQSVYWGNIYGADCSFRNVMYWYHPDYLGSVEAITDVRGEVYQFFHNTIWGEPLQDQKAFTYKDFSSRFRFNGKERDEETGNYYYGARYYDPKISVWLSVDPKADWYPSHTPYNFTLNNPMNLQDPNGMWVEGAGFFRNVFNSDEKILAQDLADEHGGEAFKHGDGWRATWTSKNNEKVEGVDVNLDDLHILDFKKGKKRDGTYDSGAHMADAKFDSWLDDNMRSWLSSWNRVGEYADQVLAPKVAKIAALWLPPSAIINASKTIYCGTDLYGVKQEGTYNRMIRPGISIISGSSTAIFGLGSTGLKALDKIGKTDQILNTYETGEIIFD